MDLTPEMMLRAINPAYQVINIGAGQDSYGNSVITVVGVVNETTWVTAKAKTVELALWKLVTDTLKAIKAEN